MSDFNNVNLDNFIIDEYQPRFRDVHVFDGKHSIQKDTFGSTILLNCKCGWSFQTLVALEEDAEKAAWLHHTNPNLVIAGSSDVMKTARLQRAAIGNRKA